MQIIDFFDSIDELQSVAPGISASQQLDRLKASAATAKKRVVELIGEVWTDLLKYYNSADRNNPDKDEALDYLRGAFGNLTMYYYTPFWVLQKKEEGQDFYRNEVDGLKDAYIENLWTYMDSLIKFIEQKRDSFSNLEKMPLYIDKEQLYIESLIDFERFYNISHSFYFFSKLSNLQVEAIEEYLSPIVGSKEQLFSSSNSKLIRRCKKAVAFYCVAQAAIRFDFTELPKNIRNNERNTPKTSRTAYSEEKATQTLSDRLMASFNDYLLDIQQMKKRNDAINTSGINYISTDINNESDGSFYMQ